MKSPLSYFYKWEKEYPDRTFLRQPSGENWSELSYLDAGLISRKMAMALGGLSAGKGTHIGIISKNCQHWILADLAIMMSGNVSVPFYPSLQADELNEVIEKSDTQILFVGKLDDWDTKKAGVPDHVKIIRFPDYEGFSKVSEGDSWDDLLKKSDKMDWDYEPQNDDLWTILFTSGTTGTPKGVMHTFGNASLLLESEQKHDSLGSLKINEPAYFSFLPLNHIAERAAVELMAIMTGGSISFAENLETFSHNLQDVQPHFFFAVPRIWHKYQQAIFEQIPPKKLNILIKIPIISRIIKTKIKRSLGLVRAHTILTGASITAEPLKQWYRNLGIELREVYGLTENFGCFTLMPSKFYKANTVGKAYPGAEGKIDPKNSEILINVPWMMTGYYKDDALTKMTLKDGWLYTGDTGTFDDEGYLSIVGRVKDSFKTSKGKFIIPSLIEKKLGTIDCLDQICVTGLGLPQPLAIATLSELGRSKSKSQVHEILAPKIEKLNKELDGHERLSAIVITNESWNDQNGYLTPTLKMKRNVIQERYTDRMAKWAEKMDIVLWE